MSFLMKVLFLSLLLAGCGDADARPDLALPDLWTVQPVNVAVWAVEADPGDPDPVGDMQLDATWDAVDYIEGYFDFTLGSDGWTIPTQVFVWRDAPHLNYGQATIYLDSGTCIIDINYDATVVPLLATEALWTTVVHELGHCMGLVVAAGDVAEPCTERLCHCRHAECSMTRMGINFFLDAAWGWLTNVWDGEPTFGGECEDYLQARVFAQLADPNSGSGASLQSAGGVIVVE